MKSDEGKKHRTPSETPENPGLPEGFGIPGDYMIAGVDDIMEQRDMPPEKGRGKKKAVKGH